MKINDIISGAKSFVCRSGLKIKNYSPEILLAAGVIGIVGGTVLACRATIKAKQIREEMKTSLDEIAECEADESLGDRYTGQDAAEDKAHVFIQSAVKMAGLYAPSAILMGGSIACIIFSHSIMSNRLSAAVAFGNTAMAALMETRAKIAEKYGKDAEEEIRYGLNTKKTTDPQSYSETDGSGGIKETEEICAELDSCGQYARFIDKSCRVWNRSSDITLMELHGILRELNDKLIARSTSTKPGYLFLSEAYERIGIPREQWPRDAGIVGWLYDKQDKTLNNCVDFGPMYSLSRRKSDSGTIYVREIGSGCDRDILIDFNVDGIIYNRI